MAKRVREPKTRSLFNKNVMIEPCVTYTSLFFSLVVVVAFRSCFVIALQKKHEFQSASSNKSSSLLHHSICILDLF